MSDIGPSEHKPFSTHRTYSVVYGDEVLSLEDELKYPYPREELPLFSMGKDAKGPIFNRNAHPKFFQDSPYDYPKNMPSITLGSC